MRLDRNELLSQNLLQIKVVKKHETRVMQTSTETVDVRPHSSSESEKATLVPVDSTIAPVFLANASEEAFPFLPFLPFPLPSFPLPSLPPLPLPSGLMAASEQKIVLPP